MDIEDTKLILRYVGPDYFAGVQEPVSLYSMQFHCNWSWLMRVVQKIDDDGHMVEILSKNGYYRTDIYLNAEDELTNDPHFYAEGNNLIESVYGAVVKFVRSKYEN
jgi:hypothetical protein